MSVYYLQLDDLLDEARRRVRRGFTESECALHFPDGGCPTLDQILDW